jgi:hypothetical protein
MKALALVAVLAWGGAAAQAPQIGRLFTTAAERQQLDQARQRGGIEAPAPGPAAPPPPPAAPAPAPVVVSGIVKRSSGAALSWVNGEVRGSSTAGYVVRTPDGRTVTVKPGQQYDPANGSVRDVPVR